MNAEKKITGVTILARKRLFFRTGGDKPTPLLRCSGAIWTKDPLTDPSVTHEADQDGRQKLKARTPTSEEKKQAGRN